MIDQKREMQEIRFRFSPRKARAALHWMIQRRPGIDLHAVLKACYFADKQHLNEHGRPIFGATYKAMRFGPVPLEVYEMAKCEPIWLPEIDADRYPWRLEGRGLSMNDNSDPDLDVLSESDREAIERGFERSAAMTFDERTASTHGADWRAANLGIMRYEDMIDDDRPNRAELVAHLREMAGLIRL